MKLARWQIDGTETFGLVMDDGGLYDIARRSRGRIASLRALIDGKALSEAGTLATGTPDARLDAVSLRPPIPEPCKIVCIGINYPERNAEYKDGTDQPKYPSLFARFPTSFAGHNETILRPPESAQLDYEGEIVLVIGKAGRRIEEADAMSHVFGVTLMNEGTIRDWLRHGKFNVTQGKNFDRSGSLGPWIVPCGNGVDPQALDIVTRVNGEERQRGNTATLIFSVPRLIAYLSTFMTLEPGDMIATGTPPGAGARFDPPRYLLPGDRLRDCLSPDRYAGEQHRGRGHLTPSMDGRARAPVGARRHSRCVRPLAAHVELTVAQFVELVEPVEDLVVVRHRDDRGILLGRQPP